MNLLEDMFFYTGPGVQALFRMGFIPQEGEFRDMTEEEYQEFRKEYPEPLEEKLLVARNRDKYGDADKLIFITEFQLGQLMRAVTHLNNLVSGETFEDDEAMLHRVSRLLPPVFTEGTRFARVDK